MEPRSPHVEGAEQLAFMSKMLDRAVEFREAHSELEGRWFDLNYLDLVEDPMAIVKIIFEHFNWPLEQTAVKRMDNWLLHQAQLRKRKSGLGTTCRTSVFPLGLLMMPLPVIVRLLRSGAYDLPACETSAQEHSVL